MDLARPAAVRFKRGDEYFIESECGRYTVCKVYSKGPPMYAAYRVAPLGGVDQRLGWFRDSTEAKAACEQHAAANDREAA